MAVHIEMPLWYAYQHVSGSVSIKRYRSQADIVHARQSPFSKAVTACYPALNQFEAARIGSEKLRHKRGKQ